MQVNDYSKYDWTMFHPEAKKERHEKEFPKELEKAFLAGTDIARME